MSIQHTSRSGKIYHLHTKPGKTGKPNYHLSTDADGALLDVIPAGYEIYENIAGQVFLRRIQKKLITDEELALTRAALLAHAKEWRYKTEIKKNIIIIHETDSPERLSGALPSWMDAAKVEQLSIRNAYYMAVLRFILVDPAKRHFAPERYCFRGSVEDWISIDPPATLPALPKQFVKHLGRESFYELF